jgi:hypothetical protein
MIGVDTNVLARCYIDDDTDAEGWRPSTTTALLAAPGDWVYCHR